VAEAMISELKPDFIFIFPWNIQIEIIQQLSYVSDWGGRFVTAVPKLEIR